MSREAAERSLHGIPPQHVSPQVWLSRSDVASIDIGVASDCLAGRSMAFLEAIVDGA